MKNYNFVYSHFYDLDSRRDGEDMVMLLQAAYTKFSTEVGKKKDIAKYTEFEVSIGYLKIDST
jgi:hypothetical protein